MNLLNHLLWHHTTFAKIAKCLDCVTASPASKGQPFFKKQHPWQPFESRFIEFPETIHASFPHGHH